MQQIQKITCLNSAGFVMSFEVQYLDTSTGEWTPISGTNSGNFPAGQSRTADLSTVSFPSSVMLRPYVFAKGGIKKGSDEYVMYADNSDNATYRVTGATLTYSITLIGAATLAH